MKIEISHGELIDKLSILEIKLLKIDDNNKLENIKRELDILNPYYITLFEQYGEVIKELYLKLSRVNHRLWEIEDEIRILERNRTFNSDFIFDTFSVIEMSICSFEIYSSFRLLHSSAAPSKIIPDDLDSC